MHTITLKALEDSIKHWEDNVRSARFGMYIPLGASQCPLCKLFNIDREAACEGCPVKSHTGKPFCQGTPYGKVASIKNDSVLGPQPNQKLIAWCEKELNFLKSLLPKEMENQ